MTNGEILVKNYSVALPTDMAITSDGATLYVAAFGSSKIGVFDTTSLENDTFDPVVASIEYIPVSGGGPAGLALDESRFDANPLFACNHQWHKVQSPRSIHSFRIAINAIADPVFADNATTVFPPGEQLVAAQLLDRVDKWTPMRAQRCARFLQFIEHVRSGGVVAQ